MPATIALNDPTPSAWSNLLPFYEQDLQTPARNDVRNAIRIFRAEGNTQPPHTGLGNPADLRQARARGWLAYCYIAVATDGWAIEDWDDNGSPDFVDAAALKTAATRLSDNIWDAPDGQGGFAYRTDYDVRWARAYERLHTGRHGQARSTVDDLVKEVPDDESAALAEAADILVYLGRPGRAAKVARTAIATLSLEEQQVPDWYFWTLAWAQYNRAVLDPAAEQSRGFKKARKTIREMRRATSERRYDFDALLLHAAISLKLLEDEERQEQINRFRSKIGFKKNKNWTSADEMLRAPFDQGDQKGLILYNDWQSVTQALLT